MSYEEAKAEAIRQSHRRWARTRARGRRRFIWVHGVLAVGVTLGLAISLGQFLSGRFHPVAAMATIVMGTVVGFFVGVARWKSNEEAYRAGRAEEIG